MNRVKGEKRARVNDAEEILRALDIPVSERSAVTLLALLRLGPNDAWTKASAQPIRISDIIDFANTSYDTEYRPNTRESIRKLSVQVFRDEGLLDESRLAKSSGNFSYQIRPEVLPLFRAFGTPGFDEELRRLRARPATASQLLRRLDVPADRVQLEALRLVNFRSLADTGWVSMRPLLLLVGRNSSGKSSFLRFFPLLRQTLRARSASPLSWVGPDVDFGGFLTALRSGSSAIGEMEVGIVLRLLSDQGAEPVPVTAELTLAGANGRTMLRSYRLQCMDREATLRFDDDGALASLVVDGVDVKKLGDGYEARREPGSLLPRLSDASEHMPEGAGDFAQVLPGLMHTLNQWLANFAAQVHYSRPVREAPLRLYPRTEPLLDQLDNTGSNLAMFLSGLSLQEQRDLSEWIAERFGFQVHVRAEALNVAIEIEIEEHGQRSSLVDMGYGLSQVLPVLVQSWASDRRVSASPQQVPPTLLALEQPELHLHPAYQERLADVFAAVAGQPAGPLSLVIETHSETLINRFGELVERGELPRERVLVLLFEKDAASGKTTVRPSEYDERGFLRDWPVGFFAP